MSTSDTFDHDLAPAYDFIVCGAGTAGSVVARRLAEDPTATVLLLEAGPPDDSASVQLPSQWISNLGTNRDWGFVAEPNPYINGRRLPMSMGRGLGGGSSINAMMWVHGHQTDWDFYASESGDRAWGHAAVRDIFRRIEDWHGDPDSTHRGTGGMVHVAPIPNPSPCAASAIRAASRVGAPAFASPNGLMMQSTGGAALNDMRIRNGLRESVFRSYVYPYLDRPNMTVVSGAAVRRVLIRWRRAVSVELLHRGQVKHVSANAEVVLSMGAVNTPKVLMQSGIGDQKQLRSVGIPVKQHLPGVGRNFQDHIGFTCVWELPEPLTMTWLPEASVYWRSRMELDAPDLFATFGVAPLASPEVASRFAMPEAGWNLFGALARPMSRGAVRLTGADPDDPVRLDANVLSHPDDVAAARRCIQGLREIGNSPEMRPFVKREVLPGKSAMADLDDFVRAAAMTYWHHSGTAKMGRDPLSVVDNQLRVYGVDGLRVADASIMPRVTTGNTMAPCVVIGERAAELITSTSRRSAPDDQARDHQIKHHSRAVGDGGPAA
jgi:choline dehydrogenase